MQNEFPRPVAVRRLPASSVHMIEATAEERAALARRFGLLSLDRLVAEVRLTPIRAGVRLDARFDADVVQECVVSLEPVPNQVGESFSLLFGEAPEGAEDDELVVEPLEGETIDIGEAVAQQLSLALDPYPRAPGARPDPTWTSEGGGEAPFAVLAKLKRSGGDG